MARRQDVGVLNETVYLNPILLSPSNTMGLTGDEALSFDFFRKRTAMEIQGCFQSSLWESLVLQIGSQEPAVMHAATAVGYAHRKHIEKDLARQAMIDEDPRVYLGLMQYIKAINCLRTRIVDLEDPEASQIALMACLLFICFESFEDNESLRCLTWGQASEYCLLELLSNDRSRPILLFLITIPKVFSIN